MSNNRRADVPGGTVFFTGGVKKASVKEAGGSLPSSIRVATEDGKLAAVRFYQRELTAGKIEDLQSSVAPLTAVTQVVKNP